MRKILLGLIIVLLLAFGITSMVKGTQIGGLKISSIQEIKENSQKLDLDIQNLNTLISVNYPARREDLTKANKEMKSVREDYLEETTFSSNEELEKALQVKNYDLERMWARVGNHAIDEGVNMTLEIKPGSSSDTRNLEFTVYGTYLGQTNFLYSLEDDDELSFRIYNFKLVQDSGTVLKATFVIRDVRFTGSLNESLNSLKNADFDVEKDTTETQRTDENTETTQETTENKENKENTETTTETQTQNTENTQNTETTTENSAEQQSNP